MSDPAVQPVLTSLRWARWAILAGAVVLAAVLASIGWANYAGMRDSGRELARGEAMLVAQEFLGAMRELDGPPTDDELAAWLADGEARGVRYLAVATRQGMLEVGTPAGPPDFGPVPEGRKRSRFADPVRIETLGARLRVVVWPPTPPRRARRRAMRPSAWMRPPRGPMAVVEFVPVRVQAMMARARRDLAINLAVGLALLAAGAGAFQLLRGREQREVARARDKQLARLGEMSAVLAHEIRNPLASLKGHAQLLAETTAEGSRERSKADRIVHEAVRLERLTGELLELVRTGAIERRSCDPAALAREVAGELDPDGRRVHVDAASAPERWSLDRERMHQVLANLVRNALEVTLEASGEAAGDAAGHEPGTRPVRMRVSADGPVLRLEVRDHGPGVTAGEEERIFEAFHTTRTRGTGLGLAVARRIVELHGGTLRAGNHPGGGAIFTALVPAKNER